MQRLASSRMKGICRQLRASLFSEAAVLRRKMSDNQAPSSNAGKSNPQDAASMLEDLKLVNAWRENNALDTFVQQFLSEAEVTGSLRGGIEAASRRADEYTAAVTAGILGGEHFFQDLRAFVLLANPVLTKYNFDPKDFLKGANQALGEVRAALCSKSFYEYVNNISMDSTESEFLKSTMHPELYIKCVEALREMEQSGLGYTHLPAAITIDKSFICDIDVRVVSSDECEAIEFDNKTYAEYADEEKMLIEEHSKLLEQMKNNQANFKQETDETYSAVHPSVTELLDPPLSVHKEKQTATSSTKSSTTQSGKSMADYMILQEELVRSATGGDTAAATNAVMSTIFNPQYSIKTTEDVDFSAVQAPFYPSGSVVVDVKVRFVFEPHFTDKDKEIMKKSKEGIALTHASKSVMEWVFSGCLSDHTDLEYQITSFGGTFGK